MQKYDFTISKIIFLDKNNKSTVMYRARVIALSGHWKVSKEFLSYIDAYKWCEDNYLK